MPDAERSLTDYERARVDDALRGLAEAAASPDSVRQAGLYLDSVRNFVEGDMSCGVAVVKSTQLLSKLSDTVRAVVAASAFDEESVVVPLLRTYSVVSESSQSGHVFDEFTKRGAIASFVVPLLQSTSSAGVLTAVSSCVSQLLSGFDGETPRSALWSAGAGNVIAQRLRNLAGSAEATTALCDILTTLIGWPRVPSTQDVDILAGPLFAVFSLPSSASDIALASAFRAATALLVANPSPSAHVLGAVQQNATRLSELLVASVFGEASSPALASAGIVFAAVARDCAASAMPAALDQIVASQLCSSVVDFASTMLQHLPDVKRSCEASHSALQQVEAAVARVPPELADLNRQALNGTLDAVRALLVPLGNIDTDIAARAARVLAFVIHANPAAANRFVALGGPSVLLDMLEDYDTNVLGGALLLMAALTNATPNATRAIIRWKLLQRVSALLHTAVVQQQQQGEEPTTTTDGSGTTTNNWADLATSLLFYLRSAAECPGLVEAPQDWFEAVCADLLAIASAVGPTTAELAEVSLSVAGKLIRAFLPRTAGEGVERVASNFASLSTANIILAAGAGTAATSACAVLACVCRYGAPAIAINSAANADLLAALHGLTRNPNVPDIDPAALDAALVAAWSVLAALTSSDATTSVVALAPSFSDLNASALRLCFTTRQDLDRQASTPTSATPPQGLFFGSTCAALQFLAHTHKHASHDGAALVDLVAALASHSGASLALRAAAVDTLDTFVAKVSSAPTAAATSDQDLAHHMLAVLLACEDAADEETDAEAARMTANRAFKLMLTDAPRTMRTLFTIAAEALALFNGLGAGEETPYRSPSRRGSTWRWAPLPEVRDADDAHDLLVAVLPLLNGCLNQDQACADALLEFAPHEAFALLLDVISSATAELGLKIVSLLALTNLVNHCRTASAVAPLLADPVRLARQLTQLRVLLGALTAPPQLVDRGTLAPLSDTVPQAVGVTPQVVASTAARGMPSQEAMSDAIETLYFLLERCVIFARSHPGGSHGMWGEHAPLVRFALRDVAGFHTARLFVLCLMQEGDEVATVLNHHDADVSLLLRSEIAVGLEALAVADPSTQVQQQVGALLQVYQRPPS